MEDDGLLLKQFSTFSARDQGSILKRVQRELVLSAILSSQDPGAFLERAKAIKKQSTKRKRKTPDQRDSHEVEIKPLEEVEIIEVEGEPLTPPLKKDRKQGHTKKTCKDKPVDEKIETAKGLSSPKKGTPTKGTPTMTMSQRIEALQKYM